MSRNLLTLTGCNVDISFFFNLHYLVLLGMKYMYDTECKLYIIFYNTLDFLNVIFPVFDHALVFQHGITKTCLYFGFSTWNNKDMSLLWLFNME